VQGDAHAFGLGDPLDGMPGQAAEHGDTAATSGQQHDAAGAGLSVERLGEVIAVEFGGDVKIVGL
jgi:hypothetical protein